MITLSFIALESTTCRPSQPIWKSIILWSNRLRFICWYRPLLSIVEHLPVETFSCSCSCSCNSLQRWMKFMSFSDNCCNEMRFVSGALPGSHCRFQSCFQFGAPLPYVRLLYSTRSSAVVKDWKQSKRINFAIFASMLIHVFFVIKSYNFWIYLGKTQSDMLDERRTGASCYGFFDFSPDLSRTRIWWALRYRRTRTYRTVLY